MSFLATWAKKAKAICAASAISTADRTRRPHRCPHRARWRRRGLRRHPGLGSLRFQVTINGPGGHSFTDAGTPNPIAALATALAALARTPLPDEPSTTLNLGTIQGGTSVNSIPESATASIDFRSTSSDELLRLEVALHRAVEDAVDQTNAVAQSNTERATAGRSPTPSKKIGDRPAAQLPADSPILETLRAVDRHLGIQTDLRLGSTDANIPFSRHSLLIDGSRRRRRRRAHHGRVVQRQRPRNRTPPVLLLASQ